MVIHWARLINGLFMCSILSLAGCSTTKSDADYFEDSQQISPWSRNDYNVLIQTHQSGMNVGVNPCNSTLIFAEVAREDESEGDEWAVALEVRVDEYTNWSLDTATVVVNNGLREIYLTIDDEMASELLSGDILRVRLNRSAVVSYELADLNQKVSAFSCAQTQSDDSRLDAEQININIVDLDPIRAMRLAETFGECAGVYETLAALSDENEVARPKQDADDSRLAMLYMFSVTQSSRQFIDNAVEVWPQEAMERFATRIRAGDEEGVGRQIEVCESLRSVRNDSVTAVKVMMSQESDGPLM